MFAKIKAELNYLENPKYNELYINIDNIILIDPIKRCMLFEMGNDKQTFYLDEESFDNLINIIDGKQVILEKWRSINNV